MIITKTPYRISLFGGGSDLPDWYSLNLGAVVSLAIDKYCYIAARELPNFFEHNYRISYSIVEAVNQVSEIKHPAFREAIKTFAQNSRLEIHHLGDLPARTGIGSSSSFAVGLINALSCLAGNFLSQTELAQLAIEFEQKNLLESVGSQDQIACALGGINLIEFGPKDYWQATPIKLSNSYRKELESRIVLVYSGISRFSSDITKNLVKNLGSNEKLLFRTVELAKLCYEILNSSKDLSLIGPLLTESWEIKKSLNPLSSTKQIESIFDKARNYGAKGGKVLGAGGGGFCLFWVDPDNREYFVNRMKPLVVVPISISDEGTSRLL